MATALLVTHELLVRAFYNQRGTTEQRQSSSDLQPLLPDCLIGIQIGRRALEYDVAVTHHVKPVRNLQRYGPTRRALRQYPGWRDRHAWTRATFTGPRK